MKRVLDIILSLLGLLFLLPLFTLIALLIKLDSVGPVFFRQERVGRSFRPFYIYKFRTMAQDSLAQGPSITVGHDARITRVGWFLRKSKTDELPQLLNVLKGDMTLVGPRPEVPRYVELFKHDYEEILTMRPGITDLASLKYRDEAALLAKCDDPEGEYVSRVLPDKIRLGKETVRRSSLAFDLSVLGKTVLKLTQTS